MRHPAKFVLSASIAALYMASCGVADKVTDATDKASDAIAAARTASKEIQGKIDSTTAQVEEYTVLVQSTVDSAMALVKVASDGSFSLDSLGGKSISEIGSIVMSLIGPDQNLAGVVSVANSIGLDIDSVASNTNGILDLGMLTVDLANRSVSLADTLTKLADQAYKISTNAQADLGAVTTIATTTDAAAALDKDHDGVPEIFDADADNNGILDALDDADSMSMELRSLPGEVRKFVRNVRINTVFLPVAGSSQKEREKAYILQLHLQSKGTKTIDSVLIDGPTYLDSCDWRIIAPPGTAGDNRPTGVRRHLASSNPQEGWHAELSSTTGALYRNMRPGDVIAFRIYSGGKVHRAFQTITWVNRETPKLIQFGEVLANGQKRRIAYADSVKAHPPVPGAPSWNPALHAGASLRLELDLMKLRMPLRDSTRDSAASLASLGAFLKDNRYSVEFWTEATGKQLTNRPVEGPVRVDAAGDSVGWRFMPAQGKAIVFVPPSLIKDFDGINNATPTDSVSRYKIDLSMWDRLQNKTSLQILFDRAK
ncbi:MAG: hypothetical protein AAB214_20330 [Fibrobacterota bacterium]